MGSGTAVQAATGAGAGVGLGVTVWAVLRFIRWLAEFIAGRLDRKAEVLEARERELEARFDSRLKHVEGELAQYRQATMLLINRMAALLPQDPVLQEVADILAPYRRTAPPDSSLDELAKRADEALRTTSKPPRT